MNLGDQLKQFDMGIDNIPSFKWEPLSYAIELLDIGRLNLREKLNIYGGIIGGAIGSVAAARPLILSSGLNEIYSLVALPVGLGLGAYLGTRSARRMRNAREERERQEREVPSATDVLAPFIIDRNPVPCKRSWRTK